MQVLALDSATNVASCAVVTPEKILVEFNLNTRKTHSERLLPLVQQALDYADLDLSAMDGFAISIGPGSFTGLRIGLATIKALGFFTKKPVAGISTLDGLAANLPSNVSGLICPVLQARKDEVYCALYINTAGGQERISDYMAVEPGKLVSFLAGLGSSQITFLGDGLPMLPESTRDILGERYTFAPELLRLPRAATIGFLGLERLQKGSSDDIDALVPFYIKASAAEDRMRENSILSKGESDDAQR